MAYDPNDAADKKIVKDLIAAALLEQATEHEADISGLKTKNADLLKKIKDAGNDGAEVARLEGELSTSQTALKEVQKSLKKATGDLSDMTKSYDTEASQNRHLLVDGGLTEALVKANVAPAFLPAVKALLQSQVTVKQDGDTRKAVVGDKSLGDFVTEWSQGDQGKHYVAAPANGGTGAPGGGGKAPTGKTIARSVYEANPSAFASQFKDGLTITEG